MVGTQPELLAEFVVGKGIVMRFRRLRLKLFVALSRVLHDLDRGGVRVIWEVVIDGQQHPFAD